MTNDDRLRATLNSVRAAASDIRKAQIRVREKAPSLLVLELDQALHELRSTEELLLRGLRPPAIPAEVTA